MFNQLKSTSALVLIFAGSLALNTSCQKDAAYDNLLESDGIDLTVQVAKGLTLPFGSTDYIYLTEVLDPEDIEQLSVDAAGNYSLSEDGDINKTTTKVDEVSSTINPTFEAKDFNLDVAQDLLPQVILDYLTNFGPAAGTDLSVLGDNIPAITLSQDGISFGDGATFSFNSKNVDKALIELKRMTLATPVVANLKVKVDNLPAKNKKIDLKGVKLVMPDFIILENETEPGVVTFSDETWENNATSIEWNQNITITGIDFTRSAAGSLKVENGELNIDGTLNFEGEASISNITYTGSDFVVAENASGKYIDLKESSKVRATFTPTITVSPFVISAAEGRFDPEIKPICEDFNIDLGDDASFLTNENTKIELTNPVITARIINNATVKVLADISLEADNGQHVAFKGISLYNKDYQLDEEGYMNITLDASKVSEGDIHKLLSPIPGNVKINITPYADKDSYYNLELGKDICVEGKYAFSAPLEFDNISFVYDETAEDVLGDDRDDVTEKFNQLKNAVLNFTVENTIPMNLDFSIVATNYQTGKEDASVLSAKVSEPIKAGSLQNKTVTTVSTELNINDLSKLGDLIFRIEGSGKGAFNANEYVKISNASITLNNGINVDLNSK